MTRSTAERRYRVSPEDAQAALDVAEDALLRRARLLEASDPGVATALRQLALRIDAAFIREEP